MASKGKKTEREEAIDALSHVSRKRPHPNVLWSSLLDAEDSLRLEKDSGLGSAGTLAAILAARRDIKPIPAATFVLTLASAVEQALELAITTHFVLSEDGSQRMFDDNANGPLGTFAAKIKAAYALGIVPKSIKEELDLIRHIRNAFAHSKENLDFTSDVIARGCQSLRLPDVYISAHIIEPKTPKVRFLISVRLLYVYLEWNPSEDPMRYENHPMYDELFASLEPG